jgi:hypothetical protein
MKAVYRQIIWALSICILLVSCVVFAAEKGIPRAALRLSEIASDDNSAPDSRRAQSQKDMHTQMGLRIKAARDSRNMGELEKLGNEIEATRGNLDPGSYAALMLEVSNALSSTDLKDDKQYVLEQKYASLVLSKQLPIPADLEAKLVLHLQEDIEYTKAQLTPEQWSEKRREKAEVWLRTWRHLNAAIDPNLNTKDLPWENVPLPAGANGVAGQSPDQIKDPTLRGQYQKAVDANEKKAETFRTQTRLRSLRETYVIVMENYLVRSYSRAPRNLAEIETSLKKYSVDESTRTKILNRIKEEKESD